MAPRKIRYLTLIEILQLHERVIAQSGGACGNYKQTDCGKAILPFTLLRRLDCVLELSIGEEVVLALNPAARILLFGQEPEQVLTKDSTRQSFAQLILEMDYRGFEQMRAA